MSKPLFDLCEYLSAYQGEFGGLPLRTRVTYYGDPVRQQSCQIKGAIETITGQDAGEFSTHLCAVSSGALEARLDLIEVRSQYRRSGFTSAFVSALETLYARTGVQAVRIRAAHYRREDAVGGSYVFALFGYEFDVEGADDTARAFACARRATAVVDGALAAGRITAEEHADLEPRLWRQGRTIEGKLRRPWEIAELGNRFIGQAILRTELWHGVKDLS